MDGEPILIEAVGPRGAGPPARDRPPRRRPDPRPDRARPAQGRDARAPRGHQLHAPIRRRGETQSPSPRRESAAAPASARLPRHVGFRGDRAAQAGVEPASPGARGDPARPAQGPRPPALAAARRGRRGRSSGSSSTRPRTSTSPESLARARARGHRARPRLRVRAVPAEPPLLERLELLNVHPSLLPRWRGAAPIERAIMAGDERTGVAIIRVTEELDAGPVALCEEVPIRPDDDYGSLSARLADLGGELAVRALELRAAGELEFTEQDRRGDDLRREDRSAPSDCSTRGGRRWSWSARSGRSTRMSAAYLELEGGERARGRGRRGRPDEGRRRRRAARRRRRARPRLRAGGASDHAVRPAGRREMTAADYLRGHPAPRLAAPR